MESNKFKCMECKKYYKSYQSLWNHKKKFHSILTQNNSFQNKDNSKSPQNNSKILIEPINKLTCNYCTKIYSRMDNLNRHKKICKLKDEIYNQNKEIIKQQSEIIKQQNEIIKQNDEIIKSSTSLTTTNNNTNNGTINNGTINNNNTINVYNFGSEYVLENLPHKEQIKILKKKEYDALIDALITTHFSKENPEGHTMFMNSITDKYASVYDKKKNKIILEPIESTLDYAIQQRINELEELKHIHKDELNEEELINLDNIVENDYPQHVVNKTKKLAVKNKDMVKETLGKVVSK